MHWDPTANGRSMDVSKTARHHAYPEGLHHASPPPVGVQISWKKEGYSLAFPDSWDSCQEPADSYLPVSIACRGTQCRIFRLTKPRGLSAGPASHYPQQPSRSEQADARWQGLDNAGFDEVPLGSPPLRAPLADSNGGAPQLEKVAHSLRAFSKGNGGAAQDAAAKEALQLRAENAILKQRLAAVESVSLSQAGLVFPTGCCSPVTDQCANTCCHRLALCCATQELRNTRVCACLPCAAIGVIRVLCPQSKI